MNHTIYISEPDAINIELVRSILADTNYSTKLGDINFGHKEHPGCEALFIRSATKVSSNILNYFPNLKAIIRAGTGLDNVDLDYCEKNDIAVFNSPGANANAVAEYVVTMSLYALRKLHLLEEQDIKSWNRFKFMGREINQITIGVIGYGHVGKLLVQKMSALGCTRFLVYDPYIPRDTRLPEGAELVSLDRLLEHSYILSLHIPLTKESRHLISFERLIKLKDGAILINASRGGVVDEESLLEIIENKDVTYAADTVEGEPFTNPRLLKNKNVIVTPHIASLTETSQDEMVSQALNNFLASSTSKNKSADVKVALPRLMQ